MNDDSTLAKLLADALAKADDLQRQLNAADARASHFERLSQHQEARLRDAADVWQSLERTLQHSRSELTRVLPAETTPAAATAALPQSTSSTPTLRSLPLARVSTHNQPLPSKTHAFPTLPPPPVPNPRNVSTLAASAPAPAPHVGASLPAAHAPVTPGSLDRARLSDSPPPAAPVSRKRKRDDDLDEELVAAVDGDGDSVSEMSLDDLILAVSGEDHHHAASHNQPQPQAESAVVAQPPRKKHAAGNSAASSPALAATSASFPALNAQGQRQCRACGQAGRYKDGKCVEKWGPGPAGPGTVCDRCRKKMKRVERRDQQPQQHARTNTASPTLATKPMQAPPSPSSTTAATNSPNLRPGSADGLFNAQLPKTLEPVHHRLMVHQLPSPPRSADGDSYAPQPQRERGFYDPARETRQERRPASLERNSAGSSPSHFGSSARNSPVFDSEPAIASSHFGHSSSTPAAAFTGYPSRPRSPSSFASLAGLSGFPSARSVSSSTTSSYVRSPLPGFAFEPPMSSMRSSGPWGKRDEVEALA